LRETAASQPVKEKRKAKITGSTSEDGEHLQRISEHIQNCICPGIALALSLID
jgi:hypothetical protein